MKNRSPIRAYFAIMSILCMAGAVIAAGVLLYNLGSKLLITDEEYIVGWNRSYEITQCDQPEYKSDKMVERTQENKDACKKDATLRVIAGRSYDYKSGMIMGFVWLFVCLVAYGFHYRKLHALKDE